MLTAPSQLGCQANGENSHQHNPGNPLNFMLDAFPLATLPIYPGLGPAWGSAGFGLVTLDSHGMVVSKHSSASKTHLYIMACPMPQVGLCMKSDVIYISIPLIVPEQRLG